MNLNLEREDESEVKLREELRTLRMQMASIEHLAESEALRQLRMEVEAVQDEKAKVQKASESLENRCRALIHDNKDFKAQVRELKKHIEELENPRMGES